MNLVANFGFRSLIAVRALPVAALGLDNFISGGMFPLVQKVLHFVLHYFDVLLHSTPFGSAIHEFISHGKKDEEDGIQKRTTSSTRAWLKSLEKREDCNLVKAGLYIGSGLCGTAAALHRRKVVEAGVFYRALNNLGCGLFLSASFMNLSRHLDRYHEANAVLQTGDVTQLEASSTLRASAFLGAVSNIGYVVVSILSTTFFCVGINPLAIRVLSIASCTTNLIKIGFDMSHQMPFVTKDIHK